MSGNGHGITASRKTGRSDRLPYAMSAIIFITAFLTLAGSFWPYMIPFSVTIQEAAAPPQSLSFMFYGAGLVVFRSC